MGGGLLCEHDLGDVHADTAVVLDQFGVALDGGGSHGGGLVRY